MASPPGVPVSWARDRAQNPPDINREPETTLEIWCSKRPLLRVESPKAQNSHLPEFVEQNGGDRRGRGLEGEQEGSRVR